MRILLDPLLRFNSLVGSTAQCERSNAPVAQFCQSIGCSPMFSPRGVVQRVRRTSSPSAKAYRWINGRDGLEVRRTRRSKRKLAAKPQATAFLRVQTSDSTKDSIEIKLPSVISILVPVSPGPVVTTTGRGCVSPPGLMNANLYGSISLYCISSHMWPLQSNSLKRGRPPQPPRPLLPRPKPRWRRGAKRLDGADVRCEV
jgi:hypothetical protein